MLRSTFAKLLLLSVCLPLSMAVHSQTDDLWTLLEEQKQARGRFIQELFDETGELLERSSGQYAVLRPEYFRWDIEFPDRQQVLLKQGELWHYDIDLASVTRRSAEEAGAFTPLELLGGKRAALEPRFAVEDLGEARYRMIPRFAGAGFASVDISWENGEIIAMAIRDRSGQQISLALTPDADNTPLLAKDFELVLPADVEVYEPDSL